MSNLANIRNKVRLLTGRKSPVSMTDAQIDFQINNYYQTEFPQQLRILDLREDLTFPTIPNVAVYPLDPNIYQSIQPPAYVAGYACYFSMDMGQFRAMWPQLQTNEQSSYGIGSVGPYSWFTRQRPITKGSVLISTATAFNVGVTLKDLAVTAGDNSNGNLVNTNGIVSGSVNYETGEIIVNSFGTSIPSGAPIYTQYVPYVASRPNMMFWWDNKITLYPIPDQAYDVSVVAFKVPTALTSALEQPELQNWWEALAYGAAMKIYENNVDFDGMANMESLLERKLNLIDRRDWYNLASQRTKTIYATPTVETYPAWLYPGFFVGN